MTKTYDIGDVIELKGVFTDTATGEPADPGEVFFRVQQSGAAEYVDVDVSGSGGTYTGEFTPIAAGYYTYLGLGRDGAKAAAEQRFDVRAPRVPRPD